MSYPSPLILLVDLDENIEEKLNHGEFNTTTSSLGKRYDSTNNKGDHNLHWSPNLPANLDEFDIVVIDLHPSEPTDSPKGKEFILESGLSLRVDLNYRDFVDPRPIASKMYSIEFNRIYDSGGIFIIFAGQNIKLSTSAYKNNYLQENPDFQLWDFLKILTDNVVVIPSPSTILKTEDNAGILKPLLDTHIQNAYSNTTIRPRYLDSGRWIPLVSNKHDECVASAIFPSEDKSGWVFIFPQFDDKSTFLLDFLKNYLPELAPKLFPQSETKQWLRHSKLEHREILRLRENIAQLEAETALQKANWDNDITIQHEKTEWIDNLLTKQDDDLVLSVEKALITLGFTKVIDVDKELGENKKGSMRYEDLRIEDNSKWILVEVNGTSGLPNKTTKISQVQMHMYNRSKQLTHNSLKGLVIINHQRNIPVLERDDAFTPEQHEYSRDNEIGLMSTWTLWRLVRGHQNLGWTFNQSEELFYRNGVILPIPTHYKYCGEIARIFSDKNALGIFTELSLAENDMIAIDTGIDFVELEVKSLEVDDMAIAKSKKGDKLGIGIDTIPINIKEKMKIYLIE